MIAEKKIQSLETLLDRRSIELKSLKATLRDVSQSSVSREQVQHAIAQFKQGSERWDVEVKRNEKVIVLCHLREVHPIWTHDIQSQAP